jgi:transcriptional regulator with XRE-family HTH domain
VAKRPYQPQTPRLGLRSMVPGWDEPYKLRVGRRIAALRLEAGLSVPELAARCGLSAGAVRLWERGLAAPRDSASRRLAEGLAMDVPTLRARLTGDPADG